MKMPWYWIIYFRSLGFICRFIGIPNDLTPTDEYNPIARWFYNHVARKALQKHIDLQSKGYY
jgi:hypothetical protein